VKYLKQHLPVRCNKEEVIGVADMDLLFDVDGNSFKQCEAVAEQIEIERRSQYQVMRHAKEVADEIRMHLPAKPESPKRTLQQIEDDKVELRAKYMRVKEHNAARDELVEKVCNSKEYILDLGKSIEQNKTHIADYDREILENQHAMAEEINRIKSKYAARGSEIKQQQVAITQKIQDHANNIEKEKTALEKAEKKLDDMPAMSFDEIEKQVAELNVEKTAIETYNDIQKRYEQLNEKEQRHQETKDRYQELDDGYKYYAYTLPKRLIDRANLPVKGLEFRDQELYVDDRHIDRLSSAERNLVAINLAVALAESKGHIAVVVDGIEILDEEHRKQFLEQVKDAGLKVIYTRHGRKQYEHEMEIEK
jgi:hypothetical protein